MSAGASIDRPLDAMFLIKLPLIGSGKGLHIWAEISSGTNMPPFRMVNWGMLALLPVHLSVGWR